MIKKAWVTVHPGKHTFDRKKDSPWLRLSKVLLNLFCAGGFLAIENCIVFLNYFYNCIYLMKMCFTISLLVTCKKLDFEKCTKKIILPQLEVTRRVTDTWHGVSWGECKWKTLISEKKKTTWEATRGQMATFVYLNWSSESWMTVCCCCCNELGSVFTYTCVSVWVRVCVCLFTHCNHFAIVWKEKKKRKMPPFCSSL